MRYKLYIEVCFLLMCLLASCVSGEGPLSLPPDVFVLPADNISRTSARLRGTIVTNGTGIVDNQYFVYGTSAEDASMVKVPDAITLHDANDASLWYANLSDLTPNTDYWYRFYAGNKHSLVYSELGNFKTLPNSKPELTQLALLSQGPLSAICSYYIADDGGCGVTQTGCYLRLQNGEKLRFTDEVTSIGRHQIVMKSLQPNTSYSLSSYAINDEGETETEALSLTTGDAIVLKEPGQLPTLLDSETKSYYASQGNRLGIVGDMNGDDIYVLREMIGNATSSKDLWSMNLADANIVSGGKAYGYGRFTDDNVVGYGMFGECAVSSIVLPDNVKRIEQNAFLNCRALDSIVLSASVSEVTPSDGCSLLKSISVSKANSHFKSVDGVLFNADASALVWFPLGKSGNYILPATVTKVGDYAFRGCSVSSFSLPEGITSIGQGAFAESKIADVSLPSTLRAIPTAAFQNCSNLSVVRIGSGVEIISDYAFDGCPLTSIYLDAVIPPVCYAKTFTSFDATVYVPSTSVAVYRNHKVWSKFKIVTNNS